MPAPPAPDPHNPRSPEGIADGVRLLPNGRGAAAILAAGIGSLALGVFAFAGDAFESVRRTFNSSNLVAVLLPHQRDSTTYRFAR